MPGPVALKPGAIGYLDTIVAHPGERLRLHVSVLNGNGRYSAQLVRLLCGDMRPNGPPAREEPIAATFNGLHFGAAQRTSCGSYVLVDPLPPLRALRLELLVCPTLPGIGRQTLLQGGGIALLLDEGGAVALSLGGAVVSTGVALDAGAGTRSPPPTTRRPAQHG